MDGTIFDASGSIARSLNETLDRLGYEPFAFEELREMAGMNLYEILGRRVGEDEMARAMEIYREIQYTTFVDDTRFFPGAREGLEKLHGAGVRLGLFTMRKTESAEILLSHFGIRGLFGAVVGYDDAPAPKPDGSHLLHAISLLGVERDNAVVVGDTVFDIKSGVDAGVRAVGVLWGLGEREELLTAGAWKVVGSWDELVDVILG